ncbi:beta-ketoacyl synthase N-terminal-like domain-containing protein [Aquicoccus sp. G2-2]|uniref:beta-ketoacyl synthase N-terminal-like domain-containing protein n=1 Tax=Aquicoccus sp. G2-2 TaxID=3092120 RepID=UPI002AE09C89|nr:beta-ketoacyl synthase N-terminal-like domain-containing protein [Aquicoccus sp. G2-2]MEA1113403.1 beta-ketoacyl synthase N-terminal-like domain-containing protein [Aquicoccus sp. G2-2]
MSGLAIIGCGARTPLGFDRVSSAAAVRAGISAIAEHPFMIDRFGAPMKVTRDAGLDPVLAGAERLAALALPAAVEALEGVTEPGRIAVVVSFGEVRPGQASGVAQEVAEQLQAGLAERVQISQVVPWMGGHAGGIAAMEAGAKLIAQGRADAVLAGGVESYLNPETLEWLDETEQLHSEENIYGFCPGEAAGFVLMARAGAGDAAPLVGVTATGSGHEENLIGTEDICLGEGLAAAFHGAAAGLQEGEAVDQIICDMNGERYRGNEYGFAVLKSSGLFRNAAEFEAPADCWGDVGAASGPLYAALVIEAEARGYAKGPLSLIWGSSQAGQRSAALLRRREGG